MHVKRIYMIGIFDKNLFKYHPFDYIFFLAYVFQRLINLSSHTYISSGSVIFSEKYTVTEQILSQCQKIQVENVPPVDRIC